MITYGSLASGIGGLDLAIEANFDAKMLWKAEYDKYASQVHDKHWPNITNLHDITEVDWESVEPIDLLTGGYPCQPFSSAGRRKGFDDERNLWPHFAKAIHILRPKYVFLENVSAHLSLGFGQVLGDLAKEGYDAQWGIFAASSVGAPHMRKRLFIFAWNRSYSLEDIFSSKLSEIKYEGNENSKLLPTPLATDYKGSSFNLSVHTHNVLLDLANKNLLLPTPKAPDHKGTSSKDWGTVDVAQALINASLIYAAPFNYGEYQEAIDHWEKLRGEAAPYPLEKKRLNFEFAEWMMGFPIGWTKGHSATQRLKMCGNAVVPQQGAYALSQLIHLKELAK